MERKLFVMIAVLAVAAPAAASSWRQDNGDHFIIKYPDALSEQWAQNVLRAADGYYDSIAQAIDYARYNKYWSWDDRVMILVYPSREAFLKATGQPAWSQGGAIHRPGSPEQRQIVTFYQEEGFIDELEALEA